jgi:hypothetical protein
LGCEDVQRSRIYNAGHLMRYEICKLEPVQASYNNRPRWSSKRRFGKRGCEKHNTGRRWRSVCNAVMTCSSRTTVIGRPIVHIVDEHRTGFHRFRRHNDMFRNVARLSIPVPVRAHSWWPAQPEEAPWSPGSARGCGSDPVVLYSRRAGADKLSLVIFNLGIN